MGRFTKLLKRLERLAASRQRDASEITLRDQTRVRLSFEQISKGAADVVQGNRSYEAYVMGNAADSSSEWARKTLEMLWAVGRGISSSNPHRGVQQ